MDTATDDLFQAADELYQFGVQLGLYELGVYLDTLAGEAVPPELAGDFDGIADAGATVSQQMTVDNSHLEAEYPQPDVPFDVAILEPAANAIREQGRQQGIGDGIEAIREWYDEELASGDHDLGDTYYAGVLYAQQQAVQHFGIEPNPDWKPAS